ncbi:MAG: Zn-dependent hydrolase [Halieaceae bacterium]
MRLIHVNLLLVLLLLTACQQSEPPAATEAASTEQRGRYDIYATVPLTADLSHLNKGQKKMISALLRASVIMDDIFWLQAYGDKDQLLNSIADPAQRRFAEINYGPWDRLDGEAPFVDGYGPKPLGAQFYPADMSKEEFEAWQEPAKKNQYSVVRRDSDGKLELLPYHVAYKTQLNAAAALLREAAELADDPEFGAYLQLRAEAITTDNYQPSDMAWMDLKNNAIDLAFGAIESYEDQLYNYRNSYESILLIKDLEWSERLERFAAYLPALQAGLPVDAAYKQEKPGSDADLGAYDVVYYAGHGNAGGKTIAINLPNDEQVQLAKGTRRLQLKNAMRAKFDKILVPIADVLIAEDQSQHITFDAFFANTMFHEVAHGLGIKYTLDGSSTVREALQAHASAIEEGKADILGLYMVQKLREKGEIDEGVLMDNYVTFMAGIFRSVRFGASSAHGKANMIRFNYFAEAGAFARDEASGRYRIDVAAFEQAVKDLGERLLVLQGDGDYSSVDKFVSELGDIGQQLQADLDRLEEAGIPVDIVFEQGSAMLDL